MVNIAHERMRAGLSQRALAQKIGITGSAVCQYEIGKRSPSIAVLKQIASVLGCSVNDLIAEKETK